MNFTRTLIAALLLVSTASQAAPATRLSTPKKVALATMYMGTAIATGAGAAAHFLYYIPENKTRIERSSHTPNEARIKKTGAFAPALLYSWATIYFAKKAVETLKN